MFSWLVVEAECVYTQPRWRLPRLARVWREAAARSH